jgi:hypothetical protein
MTVIFARRSPASDWYLADADRRTRELAMPNKVPQKNDGKKAGKSLKEKRADKQAKKAAKRNSY